MNHQSHSHKILTNFLISQATNTHRPEVNDMASPPPAYSLNPSPTTTTPLNLPYSGHSNQEAEEEESESESEEDISSPSPLKIHISTPLTIHGTSNLILLPPAPYTASTIASAVLHALKQASMSQDGIPMIDENGRLRKIDVSIDAGLRIVGSGNVVGEKGGVEGLRKVVGEERDGRGRGGEVGGGGRKRRARSLPVGERDGKRGRVV